MLFIIKIFIFSFVLLFPFASSNAVFTNPINNPPDNGNIYTPIYVQSSAGQSIGGGLEVSSGGLTSTVTSGAAIQGTGPIGVQGMSGSASAVFGEQTGASTTGYRGIYGKVVSDDDYAGVFEGIVNINTLLELSSGAGQGIRFFYQDTGISWPDNTSPTPVDLFGIYVKSSNNALRLVGHGGGVEITDKALNVRLSVSEAGNVEIPSGTLTVQGKLVCLADGTNCSALSSGAGWTDDGANVRLTTVTDQVGIGIASPSNSSKLHVYAPSTNTGAYAAVIQRDYPTVVTGTKYYKVLEVAESDANIPLGVTESGYRIGLAVQGYFDRANFAGTLASQYGIWARAGANSANPTGRINNSYAIYLENLIAPNVIQDNMYGLYQSTGSAKNYFAGTVGIGTTDPNKQLHVYQVSGANAEIDIQSTGAASSHWGIYHDRTSDELRFWNDDDRLKVTAAGNMSVPTGEVRAKWLHSTAAGDNTFAGNLSVAGVLKAGEFRYNILNINDTDSRAQFKIKTNLPFSSSMQMPTVYISGYAYGWGVPVDLKIVWYIYEDNFINYSVSSSGGYTPTVKLARENGKVVIHLSPGYYYAKMSVSAVRASMGETDAHLQGWSWVDEAISGDKIVTVPYFTSFGDGLVAQSGDLKFNDNKSVRIDSQFGNTNLIFGNYLKDNGTWDSGFVYGGENDLNIAVEGSVKANALCIEETCRDTWGAIEGSQNLLSVLNTGSDASGFTGNTAFGGPLQVNLADGGAPVIIARANAGYTHIPSLTLPSTGGTNYGYRALNFQVIKADVHNTAHGIISNGYLNWDGAVLKIQDSAYQTANGIYWDGRYGTYIIANPTDDAANPGTNEAPRYIASFLQSGHVSIPSGEIRAKWLHSTAAGDNTFAGNVGIGTTAPLQKLEVIGSIKSSLAASGNQGGITLGTEASERPKIEFNVSDNSRRFWFGVNDINTASERLTLYAGPLGGSATVESVVFGGNGNVGIGTTGPNAKLEVSAGTGNENIRIYSGNHNESANSFNYPAFSYHAWKDGALQNVTGQIKFVDRPGTSGFANAVRTSDIVFQTAHNWNGASYGQYLDDTMIIKADQNGGSVGIGAIAPGAKLEVRASSGRALRVYNDMDLYNTLLFTDASWGEQGRISGSSYNMFVDALGDAQIHIDTDNDSVNTFKVNNGANATVLTVDESGNGTFAGTLTVAGKISGVSTPTTDTDAANKAYVDAAVGATGSGGLYGEKHYFISSGTITGAAGGYAGLDAFCNSDASAMSGRAYHAYASGATGRGFKNGYIYSNKLYGSFALLGSQDPDLCRLGLSGNCNANWASNSSVYVWRTNDAMYCSNWQSSSPTENSVFNQIFKTTNVIPNLDTQFTASLCSTAQRVLCLENTGTVSAPVAPFLVDLSYTWEQARNYCISQGAHLAYIQSTGDNNYMQSLAAGNNVWIGLNDQASEGTFVWENGSAVPYTNWYSGQPNNEGGNEDCAELRSDWPPVGKWNDQNCSGAQKFICR